MITAFILIDIESVDPITVAEDLTLLEEVDNVHQTTGEHDLVARVHAENEIELREKVVPEIEKRKGVVKTSLLVVADGQRA